MNHYESMITWQPCHGSSMDHPWIIHGSSMDHPWIWHQGATRRPACRRPITSVLGRSSWPGRATVERHRVPAMGWRAGGFSRFSRGVFHGKTYMKYMWNTYDICENRWEIWAGVLHCLPSTNSLYDDCFFTRNREFECVISLYVQMPWNCQCSWNNMSKYWNVPRSRSNWHNTLKLLQVARRDCMGVSWRHLGLFGKMRVRGTAMPIWQWHEHHGILLGCNIYSTEDNTKSNSI